MKPEDSLNEHVVEATNETKTVNLEAVSEDEKSLVSFVDPSTMDKNVDNIKKEEIENTHRNEVESKNREKEENKGEISR